tara:strand:- start:429 stop:635 length:207 start_codon:yes stop_codon:yes gene_type:complete
MYELPFSLSPEHLYPLAETRLHPPDVLKAPSIVGQCGEASISARSYAAVRVGVRARVRVGVSVRVRVS